MPPGTPASHGDPPGILDIIQLADRMLKAADEIQEIANQQQRRPTRTERSTRPVDGPSRPKSAHLESRDRSLRRQRLRMQTSNPVDPSNTRRTLRHGRTTIGQSLEHINDEPQSTPPTATVAAAFQDIIRRAGSRRPRSRARRVTPGTLVMEEGTHMDPRVSDNYLDALIQRHAPTLSQQTEQTRTYRPRFLSVGAWNSSLASFDDAGASRQNMRDLLASVMEESSNASNPHKKGLTKTQLLSLSAFRTPETLENPCCICIDDVEKGQQTVLLPCSHGYHQRCIEKWLTSNSTCPLCKSNVLA
mmetsp:Transcript_22682/g.36138  ORF Transcript_22682/g.36138 Transcript_22682/m.36138 type:complete len:303 (+) Transcript_22682:1402-2310(+)